ncbi:carbohydrate sulfotransferase 3-like [Mercenaria mercenaria]|uniref:carbohydrate sulfotransferase 3-like n=1 Tax=Mercenaria mercenaria TaxID=6596 RepID=UPI00234E5ABB|nr:carbohydrate sulfotransferase 3-like [Mercenaria mercenaria]
MESESKRCITIKRILVLLILSVLFFSEFWNIPKDAVSDFFPPVPSLLKRKHASTLDSAIFNRSRKSHTSNRKIVIILAYMHTGSTYIGSIFQHHKESFYEFENLRSLMYSTRAGKVIHFLNGTSQRLQPHPDVLNVHHNVHPVVGAEAVRKMITCNHQDLDLATLANHYFPIRNPVNRHLAPFLNCQEKLYGKRTVLYAVSALKYVDNKMLKNTTRAMEIVRTCLPLLTNRCKQSKIVVEKFIRMTMEMVKHLFQSFRNLKIIHLFRDPRAMLDSQVRKGDSKAHILSTFKGRVKYMCQQMSKDRTIAKELDLMYPGQIYTLRYEDMVDLPLDTIRKVFNFIDVPFTKTDELFVKSLSRKKNTADLRKPPPLSAWRKHITAQSLSVTDEYCSSLYKEFGYIKLKNLTAVKDPWQIDHF